MNAKLTSETQEDLDFGLDSSMFNHLSEAETCCDH